MDSKEVSKRAGLSTFKKYGKEHYSKMGKKTLEKYGTDHFRKIGARGTETKRQRKLQTV